MNESQLLALVANEIDNLEVSPINDELVSLVNGELTPEAHEKLIELAKTDPKIKTLVQAYTPVSSQKIKSIEEKIMQQCFTKSGDEEVNQKISTNNQPKSKKSNKASNLLKKLSFKIVAVIKKHQQSIGLTFASASLASFFILLFNNTSFNPHELPEYTLAINGANQDFRSLNNPDKNMTQHVFSQLAKSNETLVFYDGNKPSLLLRPTHQYSGSIEHMIFLSIQGELVPIKGQAEKSDKGAIRIQIYDLLNQTFSTLSEKSLNNKNITKQQGIENPIYNAILITVIAKKDSLPEIEHIKRILKTANSHYIQENWQYFASPITLNRS